MASRRRPAVSFYKEFMTMRTLASAGVRFSVCALGDTAYEKFCQTGKDIDARLEALGGDPDRRPSGLRCRLRGSVRRLAGSPR